MAPFRPKFGKVRAVAQNARICVRASRIVDYVL